MKAVLLFMLFLTASLAGLIYFLHTPQGRDNPLGRELLSLLGYACPADRITAKELDELRMKPLQDIKGALPSPTKKIWGLTLNQTSEFQLIQWIQRKRLTCTKTLRGHQYYKCVNVPLKALGLPFESNVAELDFTLGSNNKLIFIGLLHRKLNEDQAFEMFKIMSQNLNERLGIPLRRPASSALSNEYRFSDYVARVSASKLSKAGVVLYEQHIFIP